MKLTDKDKEAIAHIASVSKEPHAAMRAEQLITGAKVEWRYGIGILWEVVEAPIWDKSCEYRLIYPKIKPAYRVYKLRGGLTSTVERTSHGKVIDMLGSSKLYEITNDWIEYDEPTQDIVECISKHETINIPKKWPTPLVERIAAIDIKAAEWIVDNWHRMSNQNAKELVALFSWDISTSYNWLEISEDLGE